MLTLLDRYLLRHFLFAYLATFLSLVTMYMVIDVFAKFEEFAAPDPAKVALKEQKAIAANTTGMPLKKGKPLVEQSVGEQITSFCRNVAVYYAYRIPVFFQRVNGIILLLAGAFTLGWMDRQNELMPILSAGVPLRRLLLPLGAVTCIFLVLGVLDTELVIPKCADQLLRQAEDPLIQLPLPLPPAGRGVEVDQAAGIAQVDVGCVRCQATVGRVVRGGQRPVPLQLAPRVEL